MTTTNVLYDVTVRPNRTEVALHSSGVPIFSVPTTATRSQMLDEIFDNHERVYDNYTMNIYHAVVKGKIRETILGAINGQ